MDFVISKVAMSVFALLAVSVLAAVLANNSPLDSSHELRGVLREFCEVVDRSIRSGSESVIEWTVPALSDGGRITMTITGGVVRAETGGRGCVQQTTTPLHLWSYSGQELNMTVVRQMDSASKSLEVDSGGTVIITILGALYENQRTLMAFASS